MRFLNRTIARPLPVITAATILGLLVATVLLPTAPLRPAWNSLIVAAATAIASLAIGVPLAVLIFRTDLPGRRWLPALFGMMLLVPLYLQAAGWDAAFGRQGWYAYQWSSLDSPWFAGRLAVVLIHAAASIPWTILLVGLGLQLVEPELEELALLEGKPIQVLWHVTLRRAATAIAVAAIWSMVTTASEMTVADMYQVRTYAEEMYVGFALGDSLGAVVIRLIPGLMITIVGVTAICATVIPWNPHDRVMTIRSRRAFPLGAYRWCAGLAVTFVILIIAGLPLASLIYKAGLVVEQSDGMRVRYWTASRFFQMLGSVPRRYADEFRGTALLGGTTATCVMLISICAAWWARRGGPRAAVLWVLIATSLALPGPLVSLAVVQILNHPTYDWLVYLYDRTIVAPVLALIVRTLPLPLLLTWLGFSTIPREQLEAARMEGASPLGEFLHVAFPQRRRLLLGSWLLAALLAAGDLSASILVNPPGFFTLPTRIFGLVHAGVDDQVAALCLFALLIYAILAGMILFTTRFRVE